MQHLKIIKLHCLDIIWAWVSDTSETCMRWATPLRGRSHGERKTFVFLEPGPAWTWSVGSNLVLLDCSSSCCWWGASPLGFTATCRRFLYILTPFILGWARSSVEPVSMISHQSLPFHSNITTLSPDDHTASCLCHQSLPPCIARQILRPVWWGCASSQYPEAALPCLKCRALQTMLVHRRSPPLPFTHPMGLLFTCLPAFLLNPSPSRFHCEEKSDNKTPNPERTSPIFQD